MKRTLYPYYLIQLMRNPNDGKKYSDMARQYDVVSWPRANKETTPTSCLTSLGYGGMNGMGWKILHDKGMILVILIQYAMHIWLHLLSSHKGNSRDIFQHNSHR